MSSPSPTLDPAILAEKYFRAVKQEVASLDVTLNVLGFIASDDEPSLEYARATNQKFNEIGINYDLRYIERLDLEKEIIAANENPNIHGIFIYFPVFNNQQDSYLRNLVDFRKDIEAGSLVWTRKLYENDRFVLSVNQQKKALLPCTPLAILKILTEIGAYATDIEQPMADKVVTIFNRSEVIGRPLAVMMSNDGATVYSFDVNGAMKFIEAEQYETDISREKALKQSDIVITGVPGDSFCKIQGSEIRNGAVCLNFSSCPNFKDDIVNFTDTYIPRIGPMTVAMLLRNLLRLYSNFLTEAS